MPSNSRKATQLPVLAAASIAQDDVLYLVDVSAVRSKQITVADLAAAVGAVVGSGTVTSVSVVTANGVSGSVSNPTTTPAITLTLGAITPTSVNSVVMSGSSTPTLAVTGTTTVSGANTGDQLLTASGDATAPSSATNLFLTLATVATPGTTGGSTAIPVVTIDQKGRVTSITTASVVAPAGTLTGTVLASNVTNSSLTTVGTIVTGTWNAGVIPILYGGTGASTATQARINLGLEIGVNVQAWDTQLDSLAALVYAANGGKAIRVNAGATGFELYTPTTGTVTSVDITGSTGLSVGGSPIASSGTITLTLDATLQSLSAYNTNGLLTQTAADTFTGRTLTGTADKVTVTNGDGVAGNPTVTIASTYAGQTSIVTLGTITTGVWTATDIAVADGGTGASTASQARTNLGLEIGGDVQSWDTQLDSLASLSYVGNANKVVRVNAGESGFELFTAGAGSGTVTSVSVVTANGVSGSVANPTTTPAITLTLGAITPTTVNGLIIVTTTGTLDILSGKTLDWNNTVTVNATDGAVVQLSGGGTVAYTSNKLSAFAATTSLEFNSVISDNSGSGLVVFNDTPTILTPTITAPNITGGTAIELTNFSLRSTGGNDLRVFSSEAFSADRTLTVVMGDANRTLTFTGNASIEGTNTGNQLYTASGDATAPSSASNLDLTLATVNADVGIWGDSSAIPSFTVNDKGLITAVTTVGIAAPAGTLTGTTIASNVVSSSLTSVGTITSGVWNGTTIAVANGGTGATTASGARTNLGLVIGTDVQAWDTQLDSLAGLSYSGNSLKAVRLNAGETGFEFYTPSVGTGTVTSVSVVTANGVSGSVSNPTTTPAITLTLGAITPSSVNGNTITTGTGTLTLSTFTLTVSGTASVSGTNTGDQLYTASGGDATAPSSASNLVLTLATVNGNVGSFGSSTSIPSFTVNAKGLITAAGSNAVIAPAGTLTGTTLASNVTLSSLTAVGTVGVGTWAATKIDEQHGGTNQAAYALGDILYASATDTLSRLGGNTTTTNKFLTQTGTGSASAAPVWSALVVGDIPDLSTIYSLKAGNTSLVTLGSVTTGTWLASTVDVPHGGTAATSFTAYMPVCGGTTSTGALQSVATGSVGQVLTYQGSGTLPTWTTVSSGGSGTVTSVSVVTANGVSGSVATPTTTPAITLTLGDITPTSVVASGKVRSGTSSDGVIAIWDSANSREITLTGGNTTLTLGGTGSPSLSLASNLLLPSGGEINWNGGDVKFSHSSNLLTMSGGGLDLSGQGITSAVWFGSPIAAQYGGTGINTSGSTGIPSISSGTWSVVTFASLMNTWKNTVSGYNGSVRQFLTHDSSGNFEWKEATTPCV